MTNNIYGGLFIAVDGVSGVGKSHFIKKLAEKLAANNMQCVLSQEPSNTKLGIFTRQISESFTGNGLACLIAANRYEHLENIIIPALKDKKIVITDRYFLSSLVFQPMDGVEKDFIFSINNNILLPDIQFVLTADEDLIYQRLKMRNIELTRFERNNRISEEASFLKTGVIMLKSLGVNIVEIENKANIDEIANIGFEDIIRRIG